jgi:integrase
MRRHIKPALGSVLAQDLTPAMVQLCHLRLSQALSLAVREGTLNRNVCAVTETPKSPHQPGKSWTASEARLILKKAENDTYSPFWLLALSTGMRRGEQLGLRWSDLDFERRMLTVRQTIAVLAGAPSFQSPKSAAAHRPVKLSVDAVSALTAHRVRQVAARLKTDEWEDNDLVFCTSTGRPLNPNDLYRNFETIIKFAGVPRIRLPDLRHTHATLLLQAGTPIKAVSERLGHAKASIMLDTYAHVLPEMQDRAVEAIDAALFRDVS